MNAATLKERAQKRARANERKRKDPRFERVMGKLIAAGYLRTNAVHQEKYQGRITLSDALWAGAIEPRIHELVPAIVLKKPAFFDKIEDMPEDLVDILHAIRHGVATQDFRGIPAKDYLAWVPRIGQKGKEPTLPKTFRFRQDEVALLRSLASALGTTETDVVRRSLRALARLHHLSPSDDASAPED